MSSSSDDLHPPPTSQRPRKGLKRGKQSGSSPLPDCRLCKRGGAEVDQELQILGGGPGSATRAHYLCLLFSSGLHQRGSEKDGLKGFMPRDIQLEIKRGNRLKCFYCKNKGATVGCAKAECKKSYHLPCGIKNQSLQQHFDQFRSYCSSHRPHQKASLRPKKKESTSNSSRKRKSSLNSSSFPECAICREDVQPRPTFGVLHAPCCGGWLHRSCIQGMARTAGSYHFRCPLCNDARTFIREMLTFGVQVPEQDALWEQDREEESQPALECSAKICLCEKKRGRSYDVSDGLWEILACHSCGSKGIHAKCGGLGDYIDPNWYCYTCRKVVDFTEEKKGFLRPVKTIWGCARGTKNGVSLGSSESQRAEIFRLVETSVKLLDAPLPPFPTKGGSGGFSRVTTADIIQHKDPMHVTLEDLIVSGLNQEYNRSSAGSKFLPPPRAAVVPRRKSAEQGSPGDSDYESAHEAQQTPAKRAKTLVVEETMDQKINNTIRSFFQQS